MDEVLEVQAQIHGLIMDCWCIYTLWAGAASHGTVGRYSWDRGAWLGPPDGCSGGSTGRLAGSWVAPQRLPGGDHLMKDFSSMGRPNWPTSEHETGTVTLEGWPA